MTVYDLNIGDEFKYDHQIFRLVSHGSDGVAQAERIAIVTPVNTVIVVGRLLTSNFNVYAEVERYVESVS